MEEIHIRFISLAVNMLKNVYEISASFTMVINIFESDGERNLISAVLLLFISLFIEYSRQTCKYKALSGTELHHVFKGDDMLICERLSY